MWQTVKLSFLFVCYYYIKNLEMKTKIANEKKEWLEHVLLSYNIILASVILILLVLAINEFVSRALRARPIIREIVPTLILVFTPIMFFAIAFNMWWFLSDAIDINQDITYEQIWEKPESEFLDMAFKIGIIMTLLIYLVTNILLALFCIISWTVATNALLNIRRGNSSLLRHVHAGHRPHGEDSDDFGDEIELVRNYNIEHRKNYLQRIKSIGTQLVIKPETMCSICWEYFKSTDEVVVLNCNR